MTSERAIEVLDEVKGVLVLLRNGTNEPIVNKLVADYCQAVPIATEAIEMQNDRLKIEGEQ